MKIGEVSGRKVEEFGFFSQGAVGNLRGVLSRYLTMCH